MYIFSNNQTRKYFPTINFAAFSFATLPAIVFTLATLSLLTSCSSISKNTKSAIFIGSNTPVICKFSDAMNVRILRTPDTIYVDAKNEPAQLSCKKDGYNKFIKTDIKGTGPEYKYPEGIMVVMSLEDPDNNISEQEIKKPIAKYSLSLNGALASRTRETTGKQDKKEMPVGCPEEPVNALDEIATRLPLSTVEDNITDEMISELDEKEMPVVLPEEPVNALDEIATRPPLSTVEDNITDEMISELDEKEMPVVFPEEPVNALDEIATRLPLNTVEDNITNEMISELDEKEMPAEALEEPVKALDEITARPPLSDMDKSTREALTKPADETNNNILSKNPAHYTLQFFSMENEPNAIRGMEVFRKHGLEDPVIRFSYTSNSDIWHQVAYGEYTSFREAKNKLQSLPEDLQNLNPWIRRFSSIQSNITTTSISFSSELDEKEMPVEALDEPVKALDEIATRPPLSDTEDKIIDEASELDEKEIPVEALDEPVKALDEIAARPPLSDIEDKIIDEASELDEKEMPAEALEGPVKALDEIAARPPLSDMDKSIREALTKPADETNNNILSKNPAHYTLQFFSMENEPNAIRGMEVFRKHGLEDPVIRFSYTSNSDIWHQVAYGEYTSFRDARNKLQSLPEDLQNLNPWIRRFSSIQSNITTTGISFSSNSDEKEMPAEAPDEPVKALDEIDPRPPLSDIEDKIIDEASELDENIPSKDPTHYTPQFFSVKNESNTIREMEILRKHNLADQVMRYSYTNESGQWHKVTYGDYETIDTAKKMLRSLP